MFEPNAISSRQQTLFLNRCRGGCGKYFTSAFGQADLCRDCTDGMTRAAERARQEARACEEFQFNDLPEHCKYCGDWATLLQGACQCCHYEMEQAAGKRGEDY